MERRRRFTSQAMTALWASLFIGCIFCAGRGFLALEELTYLSRQIKAIEQLDQVPAAFSGTIYLHNRLRFVSLRLWTDDYGESHYPCSLLPDEACPSGWFFEGYVPRPARLEGLRLFPNGIDQRGSAILFARKDGEIWFDERWLVERLHKQHAIAKRQAASLIPVALLAWLLAVTARRAGVVVDR